MITAGISESALRQSLSVFVNSFNQPTYLRDTLEWLSKHGFRNITVLDNGSKFEHLLSYYKADKFKKPRHALGVRRKYRSAPIADGSAEKH
jgi:NDP-sugar pyrophosphorylase family protein